MKKIGTLNTSEEKTQPRCEGHKIIGLKEKKKILTFIVAFFMTIGTKWPS